MTKRLSLFFIILLLLATMVETFHHHDDGDDHPECSICAATHHQADSAYTPPVIEIKQRIAETAYVQPVLPAVTRIVFFPANNRAPPA